MEPDRAAQVLAVGLRIKNLETLFAYLHAAGLTYARCTGNYAPYPMLYSQASFESRLASDLAAGVLPNALEQEYWVIMRDVLLAALRQMGQNTDSVLVEYRNTIGVHQKPRSKYPECNKMRSTAEAMAVLNAAFEKAKLAARMKPHEPSEWEAASDKFQSVIADIEMLYKDLNTGLAEFAKTRREAVRVRNSYIALGLSSLAILVAIVTAVFRFG